MRGSFKSVIMRKKGDTMKIYRAAMRNASMILFLISAVVFLIGFGQALVAVQNTAGSSGLSGEPISERVADLLMFLTGTFAALSSAAVPFIGAVAIERWDRRSVTKE